ncbi:helix-turn-helix domain-containing protein [Alkalibacillus silvisoli]|uniref:Helix-turn-helix domain-containing protein n=1 Tax=Alkalibacillus silvisoli TaxID=392823 RepID=A0ABN1AC26_9BACI
MGDLLTVKELESKLKMSRSTIYRLRKNEGMPYYEIGGKILFDLEDVTKWLKENKQKQST